jgi:hypothetical protein
VTSSVPREVVRARPHDPPTDRRLAGIHLRLGLLGLARAELEALAGSGGLDNEALVFLAEARWRTGDLVGAGEAAQAYLTAGGDDVIALVIAAEATSAVGRPSEARRLAGLAINRADVPLEHLFAGMRRSTIWPADPTAPPSEDTIVMSAASTPERTAVGVMPAVPEAAPVVEALAATESPALLATPAVPATMGQADAAHVAEPGPTESAPPARPDGFWDFESIRDGGGPSPRVELDVARSELTTNPSAAAIRLAIALRLEPDLAADILELLEPVHLPSAELELIRGDALRLLGREGDARRAYAAASDALVGPTRGEPAPVTGRGAETAPGPQEES